MQAIVVRSKLPYDEAVRLAKRFARNEPHCVAKGYREGTYLVIMHDAAATKFVDELRRRRIALSLHFGGDTKAEVDKLISEAVIPPERVALEIAIREIMESL